ncbi:type II toxin-antitoxin system ParD family antitoxin [Blastomonas sp.]|uniref:type II toxin-antitoxin system ParD family antitoxin n=1 Tax=Blastomonas sp. TaxID=1909299 RepID=UPI0026319EFD|nr:type II toxin-antitoxin system ParD family antitoxin [Blastomonas sp.]MDM7955529.1 type II toxin-antitoxin system ParD family antitoxin [Blastomonas sp.]
MAELTISIPPSLKNWIDARIAQGLYADATDYVRDLLRRDQEQAADDSAWLRAQIEEGLASGIVDAEPEDVLDAIIAEDPDLRG